MPGSTKRFLHLCPDILTAFRWLISQPAPDECNLILRFLHLHVFHTCFAYLCWGKCMCFLQLSTAVSKTRGSEQRNIMWIRRYWWRLTRLRSFPFGNSGILLLHRTLYGCSTEKTSFSNGDLQQWKPRHQVGTGLAGVTQPLCVRAGHLRSPRI